MINICSKADLHQFSRDLDIRYLQRFKLNQTITLNIVTMKITKILGTLIMVSAAMVSCTFEQVEPKRADFIPPEEPISFSTQIQPIFTARCISCHPPTANLDLTNGVAYGQITQSKYMDLANPDQSLIYTYPNPTSATHTYRKYTDQEAFLLLTWIQEGAENN
jgi:hypothetical protein